MKTLEMEADLAPVMEAAVVSSVVQTHRAHDLVPP